MPPRNWRETTASSERIFDFQLLILDLAKFARGPANRQSKIGNQKSI